jgi:hypothetical protein
LSGLRPVWSLEVLRRFEGLRGLELEASSGILKASGLEPGLKAPVVSSLEDNVEVLRQLS